MTPFYDKMNALTDEDLLKILSRKSEYQPEAIEAVEKVIKERNIPIYEVNRINADIELKEVKEAELKRVRQEKIGRFINISSVLALGYAPDMEGKQVKRFKLFVLGLLGYYILFLIYNIPAYYYFLRYFDMDSFGVTIEMITYGIVYPFGLFHFSKLRKKGWIIIFYLIMGKFLLHLFGFVYSLKFALENLLLNSKPSILDDLIVEPNYFISLFILFAFGTITWYLLKKSVLKLFVLSQKEKTNHLIGAVVFTAIYYFSMFAGIVF